MSSIDKKIDDALKRLDEEPTIKFEYREELEEQEDISVSLGDNMATSTWDDLMIQPLDLANLAPLLNTVSVSGTGGTSTYNMGASGYNYTNTGIYTTTQATGLNWASLNPNTVHITNTGIDMHEDCDITIGGRSMKKMLEGIEHRLSILVPDPNKLERYEALKKAYEHYLTLEALCNEEPKLDNK